MATVSDSIGVSDALVSAMVGPGVFSDEIAVADSLKIRLNISVRVSDVVSAPDALTSQPTIAFGIDEARALTETKVRIDFEVPTLVNDALTKPSSYVFTNVSAGAVEVTPLSVSLPPGQPNPLYVEIVTTEHTNSGVYEVALSTALRGAQGEVATAAPMTYFGIGSAPTLQLVLAISATEVEVHFSEAVANNASANDAANYNWSGGISTVDVVGIVENVVTLQTTAQEPGQLYELTVFGFDTGLSATIDTIAVDDAIEIELVDDNVLLDDASGDPLTDDDSGDFLTIG